MPPNPETVKRVQNLKAEIIAQWIFPMLKEDDDSADIMELAELHTTDIEVVDIVLKLIENMLYPEGDDMNDQPGDSGHEAAEEIVAAEQDAHYGDLADASSETGES